jgi:hypothetical protein
MFKEELKRGREVPGKSEDGAVMLYGNYDREYPDVKVRLIREIS